MNLNELADRIAVDFKKHFGRGPKWIVAAPGRVNLIGEHTDYNNGFVMPMAIERFTVMAADPAAEPGTTTIHDMHFKETAVIDVSAPITRGQPKWSNYIRGVFAGFQNRGATLSGLDIALVSSVPLGSGLSSSAALEVCTATLIEAVTGMKIEPVEKALLAQKAEHDYAHMPCGIMDQFISAMGKKDHLLLLDCRSCTPELVAMSDPSVAVLIINTNVKHELTGSEYPTRRKQCEMAAKALGLVSLRDATLEKLKLAKGKMEEVIYRRARHVVSENERTIFAAESIGAANWPSVGRAMYASHFSLKDDFEVSCLELDAIVAIAQGIGPQGGVIGCRMTGGGFGGCCVALVKVDAVDGIMKIIAADYKKQTGMEATMFVSRPAVGATIIKT